jgi:hypothetical protein
MVDVLGFYTEDIGGQVIELGALRAATRLRAHAAFFA